MKQTDETKKTAADEPLPDAAETPEAETSLPDAATDAVSGGSRIPRRYCVPPKGPYTRP